MGYRIAATLVVVVHLAFVAFVLVGGFVAWRFPSLLWLHLPGVAISGLLAITGLDCPLTTVEKWLRRRAGDTPYDGGFIAHYLVGPVEHSGISPHLRLTLRIVTVSAVVVAYLGLAIRAHRANSVHASGSVA